MFSQSSAGLQTLTDIAACYDTVQSFIVNLVQTMLMSFLNTYTSSYIILCLIYFTTHTKLVTDQ